MTVAEPITMDRIDIDNLEDVEDIPEAVRFSIVLTAPPSAAWIQEFVSAYAAIRHPIKPPARIDEDRLWIAYLPRYARELPGYLEFLKSVVNTANQEEQRTLTMHEHDTSGQKASFRELLKGVQLR
jgi:hypothetical protein